MKEAARWVDVRASVTKFALEFHGILGFNLVPAVAVKQDKMMLCKLGLNGIMCSIEASIGGIFHNSYLMFRLASACAIIIGSVDILRW